MIVATLRALKMHGGVGTVVAGKPLDPALLEEDPDAVRRGAANLEQHIAIVRGYGLPAVVAINAFPTDHASEIEVVREVAIAAGAEDAIVARHFAEGGAGAEDLARAVWAAAQKGAPDFRFLTPPTATLREQIEAIATRVYGADGVDYATAAEEALDEFARLGFDRIPVCMAKTQSSLSHDPALKGRPRGLPAPDPGGAALRRCRVRHRLLRRHAHDAGAAGAPQRRGRRHRRHGKDRRALLTMDAEPAVAAADATLLAGDRQVQRDDDDDREHGPADRGGPCLRVDRSERLGRCAMTVVVVVRPVTAAKVVMRLVAEPGNVGVARVGRGIGMRVRRQRRT